MKNHNDLLKVRRRLGWWRRIWRALRGPRVRRVVLGPGEVDLKF